LNRLSGWELPGKEHVKEYIRSMYRRNFRPRTYASALTAIYDFLTGVRDAGKTRLEEITKHDIEVFIEHEQDRGLMLSTVRTKLHCVNAFLGYAMDAGVVNTDVLARRIRLRKPETLPRAMDPDDVKQLLTVIDNPRDRGMVMVLLRTGMRIGELLNTKMNDLHLRDCRIDIYEGEKNRQGRVVYLSEDAMDALKVWLTMRDVRKAFLFYAQGRKAWPIVQPVLSLSGISRKPVLPIRGIPCMRFGIPLPASFSMPGCGSSVSSHCWGIALWM